MKGDSSLRMSLSNIQFLHHFRFVLLLLISYDKALIRAHTRSMQIILGEVISTRRHLRFG